MISRSELAAMLDDEEISDAAITRALVDPAGELERLEAEMSGREDAAECAEMVSELRRMMECVS